MTETENRINQTSNHTAETAQTMEANVYSFSVTLTVDSKH